MHSPLPANIDCRVALTSLRFCTLVCLVCFGRCLWHAPTTSPQRTPPPPDAQEDVHAANGGGSFIDQIIQRHTPNERLVAEARHTQPSRPPARRVNSAAAVVSPRFHEFSFRSASLIAEARAAAEAAQEKRKAAQAMVMVGRAASEHSAHMALALEALFDDVRTGAESVKAQGSTTVQAVQVGADASAATDSGTACPRATRVPAQEMGSGNSDTVVRAAPASPATADPASTESLASQQRKLPQNKPPHRNPANTDSRGLSQPAGAAAPVSAAGGTAIASARSNTLPSQISALVTPRVAAASDDERIYNVGGTWVSKRASPDILMPGSSGCDASGAVGPGGMLVSLEASLATPLVLDAEVRSDSCCICAYRERARGGACNNLAYSRLHACAQCSIHTN